MRSSHAPIAYATAATRSRTNCQRYREPRGGSTCAELAARLALPASGDLERTSDKGMHGAVEPVVPFLRVSVTVFVPTKLVPVIVLFLIPWTVEREVVDARFVADDEGVLAVLERLYLLAVRVLERDRVAGADVPGSFGTATVVAVAPVAMPTATSAAAEAERLGLSACRASFPIEDWEPTLGVDRIAP